MTDHADAISSLAASAQRHRALRERGFGHHEKGDLEAAAAVYRQVLAAAPDDFEVRHALGALLVQVGDFPAAVDMLGPLAERGADARVACDLGNALFGTGRWESASRLYERALALQPSLSGNVPLQLMRAMTFIELGKPDQALACYDGAIAARPDLAALHFNRGNLLLRLGRDAQALAAYEQALAIDPGIAEAHFNRGNLLAAQRRWDAALAAYAQAVAARPAFAEAHCNCGNVRKRLGQWDAALAAYDAAIAVRPDYAEAHSNRGIVLYELKRLTPALASIERAIALAPAYAPAHVNRGLVLKEQQRTDAALASYSRAIALDPDSAEAYCNRGVLYLEQGQHDRALADYDRAIAAAPETAVAHQNRAYLLLLRGDYEQGWIEHEWRWQNERSLAGPQARRFANPPWLGREPLEGRTLLLHSEQGLGDTLQFCRYVKLAAGRGARVVLEVPAPLHGLLASLQGVSEVVVRGSPLPHFDLHCPLMSLPLAFDTRLSSIPAEVPYLRAPADEIDSWRALLGPKSRPRVGLVWSGGFRPEQPELWSVHARRNVPLAVLAPLAHADVEFFSLQKGEPAESELAELGASGWPGPVMRNFTARLRDFSDTAALVEQLDLVISVDTSTAHLAGALGKPVWILNRYDGCWRWLLDRDDSPWYPTARLYRQRHPGDWDSVVARIRADLGALASRGALVPLRA